MLVPVPEIPAGVRPLSRARKRLFEEACIATDLQER